MVKNITKLVLASFILTGTASAAEVYSNNGNTINTDVIFQGYLVHDNLAFANRGSFTTMSNDKGASAVEMTGSVQVGLSYFKQLDEDFTVGTVVNLDLYPFGYVNGPWGGLPFDADDVSHLGVNSAYVSLDHKMLGKLSIGNIQGVIQDIANYSDVDIFIGTPATDPLFSAVSFFGKKHTNGVRYDKSFADNTLNVTLMAENGNQRRPLYMKDINAYTNIIPTDQTDAQNVILTKQFGLGAEAQYSIMDGLTVGAAYHGTYFKINTVNTDNSVNLAYTYRMSNSVILGLSLNQNGFMLGATGSYKTISYNYSNGSFQDNRIGFEVGTSYDLSGGQGVGLRPSIQFDYVATKVKTDLTGKDIFNFDHIPVMATELGLSYYVTPNLSYVAAAIIDLRNKSTISDTVTLSNPNPKSRPNHYFGVGVMYKF